MSTKKDEPIEDIINSIKTFFFTKYSPAKPGESGVLFMSTNDIYFAFYSLYPSKTFKPDTVASWLIEGGFKYIDMGTMKFEWVLKEKSTPRYTPIP